MIRQNPAPTTDSFQNLITVAETLAAVLFGFLLGQLSEWYKSVRMEKRIRTALLNELTVIHDAISSAASVPDQPGRSGLGILLYDFPFITDTYDSLRTEIASSMNASNLARLQSVYRFIAKMNQPAHLEGDGEVNNFGYIRVIGSTDYLYLDRDSILMVNGLIRQAIDGLEGSIRRTVTLRSTR